MERDSAGIACLSSPEAADAAGITYRQLDYWVRNEIVRPLVPASGSGSRRLIRLEDIPRLRLLGRLHAQLGTPAGSTGQGGVNPTVARQIMRDYRRGSMIFDGFALSWKVEEE